MAVPSPPALGPALTSTSDAQGPAASHPAHHTAQAGQCQPYEGDALWSCRGEGEGRGQSRGERALSLVVIDVRRLRALYRSW